MSHTIVEGSVVSLHFSLHTEGEQIDSSAHGDPIVYLHGAGNVVPGLERALTGRSVGERLQVSVPPEDGYGLRREGGTIRIPRADLPPDIDFAPGMSLGGEDEHGNMIPFWIAEVDDDSITVDGNHPLAGKTLDFDVTVLSVREATREEIAHGHPHGPGGAH